MFCIFSHLLARGNSNSSSRYNNNSSNKQTLQEKIKTDMFKCSSRMYIGNSIARSATLELRITKSAIANPIGASEKGVITMDSTTKTDRERCLKQ